MAKFAIGIILFFFFFLYVNKKKKGNSFTLTKLP